ncbi:MAG: alpha/beta hydrolase [Hyphomonadaceae bacterium]
MQKTMFETMRGSSPAGERTRERRGLRVGLAAVAALCAGLFASACVHEKAENTMTESAMIEGVTMRMIETNGITLRVAEAGPRDGPLVLLVHGWPESWYSWRHQIPAIAAAGYHVLAPDMRGYGGSDRPPNVEDYDIHHTTGDLVGLVDAAGADKAIIIGHDWGSIIAWNSMLLHPDRYSALYAMSVPYGGRGRVSPLAAMKKANGDNFYYILYHQEPGVAEAEYDADPRGILSRLYASPDTPREPPVITDPKRSAGGWIGRLGKPKELPAWLAEKDLDYIVSEFKQSGFRGGVNYYRNFDRNWETTADLDGKTISVPVAFLAGEEDIVIRGATADQLTASMSNVAKDLRSVTLIPHAGHWIQQEEPEKVNALVLDFLASLKK